MTMQEKISAAPRVARRSPGPKGETVITLAILAVGGQGGGVLTNWITAVAEANGYNAQSTSVAGVAQRTGATIYYIEMCRDTGRKPVFALAPSEGDVDILIASELMETGRAIMRGFVTPGRTTVIASTHRILAVAEKIIPGDGHADSDEVLSAMQATADKLVAFDMENIAKANGSMISSSLLGGLAGSGALPFPRNSYEQVIRASGRGAEASLRAFGAAYDIATGDADPPQPVTDPGARVAAALHVPHSQRAAWDALQRRVSALPAPTRDMVGLGLQKVVDYQDVRYGGEYLDRVEQIAALDHDAYEMTAAAAKYVARALCYDDILRVADLKTRGARMTRVRGEIGAQDDQVLTLTEYFHPRWEEFVTTLPRSLGRFLSRRTGAQRFYTRHLDKGRRIRTDRIRGFLTLWIVSSLRPWRRSLLRHETEMAHVDRWFGEALRLARSNPAMATEVLTNYRLIKGYSDTHSRGLSKFARVMAMLPVLEPRDDGPDWMRRLRTAALADAEGQALDGVIATINSFA